jgi:hypothetical protein
VSLPDSIVAAQLERLLEKLAQDRESRCSAAHASARERARALARAARSDARRRMREAVRYERMRLAETLALRRAELDAAQRTEERATLDELVKRARAALPVALERRWRDAGARRAWCDSTLAMAARRISGADWTIEIAPGTSKQERDALLARARELRTGSHTLSEREDLRTGLRVRTAGATLDATAAGLLDDAQAIGAYLLREWLRDESRSGAGAVGA